MIVKPGDQVLVLTAFGEWVEAIALSGVEGTHNRNGRKIHDFPVVWVKVTTKGGPLPWPAEDVREAS